MDQRKAAPCWGRRVGGRGCLAGTEQTVHSTESHTPPGSGTWGKDTADRTELSAFTPHVTRFQCRGPTTILAHRDISGNKEHSGWVTSEMRNKEETHEVKVVNNINATFSQRWVPFGKPFYSLFCFP